MLTHTTPLKGGGIPLRTLFDVMVGRRWAVCG